MTAERMFVDTNVLVYAYDQSAMEKHVAARTLLSDLWLARSGVMSTQVLQEFYVNATRKLPRPLSAPRARILIARYATWPIHRIEPSDIVAASELEKAHRMSFWDSLVIISAARMGATTLATEDLQHGRKIAGLTIVNPFLGIAAQG